jgi:ABC-2 type transport system permease protein
MMHKILIIAKREYLERVRAKSFIFLTLFLPALMFGLIVVPTLISGKGGNEARHLVVVATDIRSGDLIRQQLTLVNEQDRQKAAEAQDVPRRRMAGTAKLTVDVDTDTSEARHQALSEMVKQKQLDGVLFATQDALMAKKIIFLTRDVSSFTANEEIQRGINEALRRDLLKSKGMSDQEIESALKPVDLEPQSPTGMGNAQALFFTVFSLVMVLYVTVLLHGVNVMRAVLEEKTSRVMEVMLSTARSSELMAGKILGVAAVGLTQIGIWAAMVIFPSAGGLLAGMSAIKGILSPGLLVYFAVFFLLGFALYSTLCAAVGAMVNSEQEAQQLQFVVMLPMIVAVIILVNVFQYPSSPMAVWASMFPLTAPLIMFMRVALQSPPIWQIALSIILMIATVFGLVWACGRIYRVGILMYGKKPTLPELMKWIRYA